MLSRPADSRLRASGCEEASETLVDRSSVLTSSEASRLGAALATVVITDTDSTAKETELTALGELAGPGPLTRDGVFPLAMLGRPTPGVTGREHLETSPS